jgi:5-methylcytosine-specific restriction endonuclease McrA
MSHRAGLALDSSVLVLNKLYMALRVINARRAFCLLAKNLAEVVVLEDGYYQGFDFAAWLEASRSGARRTADADEVDFVRAVRHDVEVPRVIRLLGYDRVPRQKVRFSRRNVFARDGHRCQYCGKSFATSELSLDHVVPRSKGGPTSWENMVAACLKCNVRKGGRTPHEAGMRLLGEPTRPRVSPALSLKLGHRKYTSWRAFLEHTSWAVDVR